ncbi:hypothetical protein E3N88_21399 [Mikania micrantha]|uniref:Histidine-containing phosphotransfer protein n=1 Tax=Mikania micrantha TaxID=192012 RepID=A0A5N6NJM7_9ASTR|nr:hypothetical protein E3N88_21399 [Mikania micrantha]
MLRQIANTRQSLFDQGYLDEQFIQLEELQDNSNPNFVEEVVTLFYRDSARFLSRLDQALENRPLDFNKLDGLMHQFKGSSTSIGAKKVKTECTHFRNYCNARNAEECKRTFQNVKKEYTTLRKKLEAYFQLSKICNDENEDISYTWVHEYHWDQLSKCNGGERSSTEEPQVCT